MRAHAFLVLFLITMAALSAAMVAGLWFHTGLVPTLSGAL